jgi:hypothetical protein
MVIARRKVDAAIFPREILVSKSYSCTSIIIRLLEDKDVAVHI